MACRELCLGGQLAHLAASASLPERTPYVKSQKCDGFTVKTEFSTKISVCSRRSERDGQQHWRPFFGRPLPAPLPPVSLARRGPTSVHRKTVAVLKESQKLILGTRAPDFKLPEPLTGRMWSLEDFEDQSALLVMFICCHCPFVVHLKPSITAIGHEYMKKGVGVVAISSNSIRTHPQDGPEAMKMDAQTLKYEFPYLYDEAQAVAISYQAACTPDFYLFKKDGRRPFELVYHGQWDDSRPSNGIPVTGSDIRMAMDMVLSGQPVSPLQKPSIGCNIKWHPGAEPDYF